MELIDHYLMNMNQTRQYLWLPLLALLCVAADSFDDAIQAGYRAYLNSDYDTAIKHYQHALSLSDDPGRVSLNLGCIFAKAGRYADAAQAFTRSLEDAVGPRRVHAAVGQATMLTYLAEKQQGKRAVALLLRALPSYEIALRELVVLPPDQATGFPMTKADIEHNRSIAQTLLQRKQQEPDPPDSADDPSVQNPLDKLLADPNKGTGNSRKAVPLKGQSNSGAGTDGTSSDTTAGRGNLPALPDDENAPPLSADEAHRQLDQLLRRLRQPRSSAPIKPGTRDW